MKLFRHLKEKRYLILAFTLPAILLALAIVFLQPAQNHAKVQVKVGTKQSSSSKPKASSKSSSSSSSSSSSTVEAASQTEASSTPAVASAPTPSSAQEAYQAPQYNYVPPTAYTESHSDAPSYTAPAYSADVSSGTAE
ncbi:Wzz/FepE/Etk N-terminal domain-containing protein [Streptococcus salivarius]|uniref:Wzz/FepE/Etk N-terminal domain-containing protein n=1 Tax=Streptococcus salivarius TaxID=1304 RepID=UPI0039C122B1